MSRSSTQATAALSLFSDLGQRLVEEWSVDQPRLPGGPALAIFGEPAGVDIRLPGHEDIQSCFRLEVAEGAGRLKANDELVARVPPSSLPLQGESLGLVFLCNLVSGREDPFVSEACRVLQPGGALLVLGLNRYGLGRMQHKSGRQLRTFGILNLRAKLERENMILSGVLGAGLAGKARPRVLGRGLWRPLLPLADVVLITARKDEPPARVSTLQGSRRGEFRAVRSPGVLAGS